MTRDKAMQNLTVKAILVDGVPMVSLEDCCREIRKIDEPMWHTGEPAEEGLYLIRFKNGSFAVAECRYDEDTEDIRFVQFEKYDYQGNIMTAKHCINPTSVVWQKIEPYEKKEKANETEDDDELNTI